MYSTDVAQATWSEMCFGLLVWRTSRVPLRRHGIHILNTTLKKIVSTQQRRDETRVERESSLFDSIMDSMMHVRPDRLARDASCDTLWAEKNH